MRSVAGSRPGTIVAGLTAAALAAVGFLAYQASAAPDRPVKPAPHASATGPSNNKGDKGSKGDTSGGKEQQIAIPADSGTGLRVVYSLGQKRVWLVGSNNLAIRTYEVVPSSVSPQPGTYAVTSRSAAGRGSDGIPVEHIIRFNVADQVVFGFSTALGHSAPDAGAAKKTGAIREQSEDGNAMWRFATVGVKVIVVP